jgi:hypothetical protein
MYKMTVKNSFVVVVVAVAAVVVVDGPHAEHVPPDIA